MRYFKHYPGDALIGTATLDDEHFALYVRLWWMMQESGGPVPFEPEILKFVLRKRPQAIRRLVDQLVALGKLSIDAENMIHNRRVDADLEEYRRNETLAEQKRAKNGAANGGSESQKTQQDLRARTRSPARSKQEQEAETYRRGSSLHGSKSARTFQGSILESLRQHREMMNHDDSKPANPKPEIPASDRGGSPPGAGATVLPADDDTDQ